MDQIHPALAFSRGVGDGVAFARSPAIAEIEAGARQAHPLQRFSASAQRWIFRVHGTFTAFGTTADQRFSAFNSDDVTPFKRVAAFTVSRGGAHGFTVAFRSAVARIHNILAGGGRVPCLSRSVRGFRFHIAGLRSRTPKHKQSQA